MPRFARSAILPVVLVLFFVPKTVLMAEDGAIASKPAAVSCIVVGFTGGFVRHDSPHHGPVQLAARIQQELPKGSYVRVFENRHRRAAYNTIIGLLDRNHDGVLSDEEKTHARVILFGHSWGGSAVVMLARELNRKGIPVRLTVQVDSIRKPWQHDKIIPENVASAVNFYQPHGLLHGRPIITAADDSKTQILGNYLFDYRKAPVKCENAPWFYRTFSPGHMQSDCDPKLWSRVDDLIRQHIEFEPGTLTAISQP